MSFTQEEIEFMDKEVDEDMEEQDTVFEDDVEEYGTKIRYRSSDSEDSITGKDILYYSQNSMYNFICCVT